MQEDEKKMTTNHTCPLVIITHKTSLSVWITSTKIWIQEVYNKRRSKDRYRWKQKKRRGEYSQVPNVWYFARIKRERERGRDIYTEWKISSHRCLTTFLMLRARRRRRRNGTKMATNREVKYMYIQSKWNKTITNILSECALQNEWETHRRNDRNSKLNVSNFRLIHLLIQVYNPAVNCAKHISTTLMFTKERERERGKKHTRRRITILKVRSK